MHLTRKKNNFSLFLKKVINFKEKRFQIYFWNKKHSYLFFEEKKNTKTKVWGLFYRESLLDSMKKKAFLDLYKGTKY